MADDTAKLMRRIDKQLEEIEVALLASVSMAREMREEIDKFLKTPTERIHEHYHSGSRH